MGSFPVGALLGLLAGLAAIATGRVHRDHRGFSPPDDAAVDVPWWIVVLLFAGMGVLGPLVSVWRG